MSSYLFKMVQQQQVQLVRFGSGSLGNRLVGCWPEDSGADMWRTGWWLAVASLSLLAGAGRPGGGAVEGQPTCLLYLMSTETLIIKSG